MTLDFGYGSNNNNGNVLTQSITRGGTVIGTQTYTYDNVNRLLSMSEGGLSRNYGYDAFGNRAVVGSSGHTLPAATPTSTAAFSATTNRLAAGGYDAAGNLTALAGLAAEMRYDAANKMTFFDGPTATQEEGDYFYDGQGQRVYRLMRIAGTQTETTYVYDAFGKLAAEYSSQAPTGSGETFYRTTDHLGSTRLVTKADGMAHQCRDFFPFGEKIDEDVGGRTDPCYSELSDAFKQQFTAKERDDESNLDYFLAPLLRQQPRSVQQRRPGERWRSTTRSSIVERLFLRSQSTDDPR